MVDLNVYVNIHICKDTYMYVGMHTHTYQLRLNLVAVGVISVEQIAHVLVDLNVYQHMRM